MKIDANYYLDSETHYFVLGEVTINGRPVGPDLQRYLEKEWVKGDVHLFKSIRRYRKKMSRMHSMYRRKKFG